MPSWPQVSEGTPRLQGFAGYKAGMTHVIAIDPRAKSTTAGQEVQVPVTVLEVPPMRVAAVRYYQATPYGLRTIGERWASKQDAQLLKRHANAGGKGDFKGGGLEKTPAPEEVDDVRVLAHTQPIMVTGIPKKRPDLMEVRVAGGSISDRIAFAEELLGKEVPFASFAHAGAVVDIVAVTKGKGFQGSIKRWGVKLLTHKNSKRRRQTGTAGPWHPSYIMPTVPQAGQMGYHQRTEYNKPILKVGDNGDEVTPSGGFLHYGNVRNTYALIHGSIPGPAKRLIRLRDPTRSHAKEQKWEITYVSTESKQGN